MILVLNSKIDLGEALKSVFEAFLGWLKIWKYFMIFLKIKIVADFICA